MAPITAQQRKTPWKRSAIQPCALVMRCAMCQEYRGIEDFCFKTKTAPSRFDIFGRGRHHQCRGCQSSNYQRLDLRKKLLYAARNRAKQADIECTITIDDILIPDVCPVLGIPLYDSAGGGKKHPALIPNSPSIDRIDNTKGYVPDNICVISMKANDIKSDSTLEDLEAVVAYMKSRINKSTAPLTNDTNPGGEV